MGSEPPVLPERDGAEFHLCRAGTFESRDGKELGELKQLSLSPSTLSVKVAHEPDRISSRVSVVQTEHF